MASGISTDVSELTSWSSEMVEEFKNVSLEHVHGYLSSKVERLNKKVEVLREIEKNNVLQGAIVEDDQIAEFVAKSRLKRIYSTAEVVKDEDLLDYTPFLAHLKLDIVTELKQEINELENLLIKSKKELVDSKEELASLESKIRSLNEIMEKRKTEGEMLREESFEAVKRALHREFQKHQQQLKRLLSELYPDDKEEITDVLKRVVDKYFEEGDDYIELTTSTDYRYLEFLFEAHLLERHPYATNKIKLAKLLD